MYNNITGGSKDKIHLVKIIGSTIIVSYDFKILDNDEVQWREIHLYKTTPAFEQVKKAIIDDINSRTDEKILTGFVWNEKPVYLSSENQFNFKAAYDLAVQTQGQSLPVTFKLGEKDGEPIYYEFTNMVEFTDFYVQAISFINNCLKKGWREKDSIDFEPYKEFFEEKNEEPQTEPEEQSQEESQEEN